MVLGLFRKSLITGGLIYTVSALEQIVSNDL